MSAIKLTNDSYCLIESKVFSLSFNLPNEFFQIHFRSEISSKHPRYNWFKHYISIFASVDFRNVEFTFTGVKMLDYYFEDKTKLTELYIGVRDEGGNFVRQITNIETDECEKNVFYIELEDNELLFSYSGLKITEK